MGQGHQVTRYCRVFVLAKAFPWRRKGAFSLFAFLKLDYSLVAHGGAPPDFRDCRWRTLRRFHKTGDGIVDARQVRHV